MCFFKVQWVDKIYLFCIIDFVVHDYFPFVNCHGEQKELTLMGKLFLIDKKNVFVNWMFKFYICNIVPNISCCICLTIVVHYRWYDYCWNNYFYIIDYYSIINR